MSEMNTTPDSGEPTVEISTVSPTIWWKRPQTLAIAAVGIFLVWGFLILAVGRDIPVGTRVGEINLSRLTLSEARIALKPLAEEFAQSEITLTAKKSTTTDIAQDFGIAVDIDQTLASVSEPTVNPFALLATLIGGRDLNVAITADASLNSAIAEVADSFDIPAQNATVTVESGAPRVVASKAGRIIDQAASLDKLMFAIAKDPFAGTFTVDLVVKKDIPIANNSDAQKLIDEVITPALSGDVTITTAAGAQPGTAVYTPADIAEALRVRVVDGELVAQLDPRTVRNLTDPTFSGVETPVQNATWDVSSGTPVVVPAKPGYGVTDRGLAEAITSVWLKPEGERAATVDFGPLKPKFSTSAASKMGITELVASYRQTFPYAAYRSQNIGQAAEYINGTFLKPGDEFSMNRVIKERTYENGYTDGWIIAGGGIFRMEPGGGVSTATTAMFNAAWFAGMEFVEWRAHSVWIPDRYIPGREATVFWGALDMRFVNNHPTGIFITTEMTSTSMTVKFWGTKQWDKIDTIIGPKRNISQPRDIVSTDPDCNEQNGVFGFQITTYRTFYKGEVLIKEEPFNTSYRASPSVICQPEPKPSPTKTVKPSS